jgi:uncharacterized protein
MRGGRNIGLALAAAAVMVLSAASSAPAKGKIDLNIGAGNQGGSQYPITVALGQLLQKMPEIGQVTLMPGSSIGNIIRVETGKAEIAISMSQSLRDGRLGLKPFTSKTTDVVNLFSLHPFSVVAFVPQDSPIKSFKDFAGKRLNIAPKGYSIREVGDTLLQMEGIANKVSIGTLRITEAVEEFKDGHYDGIMYAASSRMPPFMNLAETRDIRLVKFDHSLLVDFAKNNPSFYLTTWPPADARSAYTHLSNSVETLAYPNVIVASSKLSNQLAYDIVKYVAEHFDEIRPSEPSLADFNVKDMARQVGSPFHPGALKYYRERGWIK